MKLFGEKLFKISSRNQHLNYGSHWSWKPAHVQWLKNPNQFRISQDFLSVGMDPKILIIAPRDVQTGALIKQLRKKKKPFVYMNWDRFALQGDLNFSLSKDEWILSYKNKKIDLKKIKAIYYVTPDLIESQMDTSNYFNFSEKLFINRWSEVLLSIEDLFPRVKWLPAAPSKLKSLSQKKLPELRMAQSLGLSIPETLVTTNPKEARQFFKKQKNILMREFGRRVFLNSKNQFLQLENELIRQDSDFQMVGSAPTVFQRYISKEYEVRVLLFSHKVLACKIDSKESKNSVRDWRGSEAITPFSNYKLPKNIQSKLQKLKRQLGFNFATVDLVKGGDGKYYFLEMNRPGNWLFVEALSGVRILEYLGRELSEK